MFFSSGDIAEYEAYWRTYKKWEVKIKSKKFTLKLKPLERILGVKKFLEKKRLIINTIYYLNPACTINRKK